MHFSAFFLATASLVFYEMLLIRSLFVVLLLCTVQLFFRATLHVPGLRQLVSLLSIFLGGITGGEGQKAAGIVVVLLLWRIARVVDGSRSIFVIVVHPSLYLYSHRHSQAGGFCSGSTAAL